MKLEPLKMTIDDQEVTFGTIGFRVYVDATHCIRENKEKAFSRVVANLSRDPLASSTTAASAIDGYMAGMIVSDFEVRQWLFSPEGEYFLFGYSLRKVNKELSDEQIDELYDQIAPDQKADLGEFYTRCIMKHLYKEEPEEAAAEPVEAS